MSERPPLVVHIIYALATGGLENGLVNIINRSSPDRYRHAVICLTAADDFAGRITAPGVEVYELHKPEGHSFATYRRLRRLLRELRPAIVHSRNMAALEAQLTSLALGVRRVHGEHGREIGDLDGSNRKYLLLRKFMRLFVHRYITVSRDLEKWLVEKVGAKAGNVTQIYNGVDHDRFSPATVKALALLPQRWREHDGILVVGTVGRLTPVKDQQLLLQALAIVREMQPEFARNLRLLIVGDGPLREALQQQAELLNVADHVWFAGDRSDVPELLTAMDVFALPSLGEGISNTVLEAMSTGLPVVATAVGGNVELVEPGFNGELIPVGDARALAAALLDILGVEGRRELLGRNALIRVRERFDWNRTVLAYNTVYDELLGRADTSAHDAG